MTEAGTRRRLGEREKILSLSLSPSFLPRVSVNLCNCVVFSDSSSRGAEYDAALAPREMRGKRTRATGKKWERRRWSSENHWQLINRAQTRRILIIGCESLYLSLSLARQFPLIETRGMNGAVGTDFCGEDF